MLYYICDQGVLQGDHVRRRLLRRMIVRLKVKIWRPGQGGAIIASPWRKKIEDQKNPMRQRRGHACFMYDCAPRGKPRRKVGKFYSPTKPRQIWRWRINSSLVVHARFLMPLYGWRSQRVT